MEEQNNKAIPAWKLSRSAWKAIHGIHEPWIAEIAPAQYARLSKRARAEYDKKRAGEWDASAAGTAAYDAEVYAAHQRGEIVQTDAHPDALGAIRYEQERAEEAKRAELEKRIYAENTVTFERVKIGDRVHRLPFGYGVVERVSEKSIRVRFSNAIVTAKPHTFSWLGYDGVKGKIEAELESEGAKSP